MSAEKPALIERRYSKKQEVDFANLEASDGHCGFPRRMYLLIAGTVAGGLCDQGSLAGACRSAAEEGWTSWQDHVRSLMTTNKPMTKLDVTSDPRIIPFGNLIRRCCLDELPQLINVLRGEMSLVGPRPCVPYEAEQYGPWERGRFDAVPGMTGLWQVSGKNKTTFNEMIRLDIAYARRRSFWLDIKILLRTMPAIYVEVAESLSRRRKHDTQQASAPVQKCPQPLDAGQLGTEHD